ncbi:MAG: hydrogenase formation protein HypD [Candidatus Omnitrophica bacterium]|nr:hydrogenase formation protein HypD [Candidatus Omnitrophota bacterium]
MKYIDEFRNKKLIASAAQRIRQLMPRKQLTIMEVCGTHTMNFCRFGLKDLLPENLHFIPGPGCPVCVSHQNYIDAAIRLARRDDVIIVTFGDMLRVPGTNSSLEKERARGGHIRIAYSPLDTLKIARLNPGKKAVFLGVGFETTAPTIALSIIQAKKEKIKNVSFFVSLKLMPPVMKHLLNDERLRLSGFLCPGHVSSIIGTKPYEFIPRDFAVPCCVAGFEPLDILEGILMLLKQIRQNKPMVDNQYSRVVRAKGNLEARKIISRVFTPAAAYWRGMGKIPGSGLKIRDAFSEFDSEKVFSIKPASGKEPETKCKCADVLKGLIIPKECPLFARACVPDKPLGPCMVSMEGACNAYYRYRG